MKPLLSPLRCCAALGVACLATHAASAQSSAPTLLDTNLLVTTVVTNLEGPTSMAFLRKNDFFVLEKGSGRVQRVMKGAITNAVPTNGMVTNIVTTGMVASTVLDLAVNSASERGLLGIALHPRFPSDPGVYLYWTESSTGADSMEPAEVPVLGNRVDRFRWDGSGLTHETNVIQLRAFQSDIDQPLRGNHDGGVIRFGPDGKLYIYIGDVGRRGQMQNLPDGPGPAGNMPDDQFGGPEPDNAHLTGVILRLNADGTIPRDNPFYRAGAMRGGEAGTNLQKVFAYGIRNGFGMAFDPISGSLWEAQNGDDTFTEINLIEPGVNLGWVQAMGPLARIAEFKSIETSPNFLGLQQIRWSPTNIADTAEEAISRLFWIYEGGNQFGARLSGASEVPPVETDASATARFALNRDGTLAYDLRATGPIEGVMQAHIHLGARGQNGPVAVFLFGPTNGQAFARGDLIARGTLEDADLIALTGFTATISNLVERMRQGRAYVNLHTMDNPAGEIRGQITITDRDPVSHYSDPEFSWKYEVAPAGIGFVKGSALGSAYLGDLIVGAARETLEGGNLFRFNLTWERRGPLPGQDCEETKGKGKGKGKAKGKAAKNKGHGKGKGSQGDDDDDEGDDDNGHRGRGHDGDRDDDDDDDGDGRDRDAKPRLTRTLAFDDPRLQDRVADNVAKFDITESESLLFGTNFGVVTDIQSAPDGTLYLVSLTHGNVYKIQRRQAAR